MTPGTTIEDKKSMHAKDCPYCSLARKIGGLYCSKHGDDMRSLESGVFFIHRDNFEQCDWHETRLAMNFNLDNSQQYAVDGRVHTVTPHRYLLINEGQWFKTSASYGTAARMLTVAFKVGIAGEMYSTLTHNDSYLLDHPGDVAAPLFLFDKTYPIDDFLRNVANQLSGLNCELDGEQLNEYLDCVLQHLLIQQAGVQHDINRIGSAKLSTRQEIYRRLSWTLDYIDQELSQPLTTNELAQQACLSLYHFKRLFKEVHGVAPYQYIKSRRLERAKDLLTAGRSVSETCKAVGWDDPSSFIRLYRKVNGTTPGMERAVAR